MKILTECARGAVMLDGEKSKCVCILKEVAQVCMLSPDLFKICTRYVLTT